MLRYLGLRNMRSRHSAWLYVWEQTLTDPRRPEFDSPSVFCRLLDKDKGGHFSIHPAENLSCTTKQQYLPSSNILQTRYIHEDGVVDVVDFFPRPKSGKVIFKGPKQSAYREMTSVQEELKQWLVRRVECIRGRLQMGQCAPPVAALGPG